MYLLPISRSTTLPTIMVCPTTDNNKFWTPLLHYFENLYSMSGGQTHTSYSGFTDDCTKFSFVFTCKGVDLFDANTLQFHMPKNIFLNCITIFSLHEKKNLKTQLIHLAPRNIFDFEYIRSFGKLQLSNKNIKHAYGAVTILFDSLDIIGGRVTFYCCRSA